MLILSSLTVLALTVIALWLKGVAISLSQVVIRVRSRRYTRPEDARMMGVAPSSQDERVERLSSAWRNEHETAPAFVALSIAYVMSGGVANPFWLICASFVACRYAQGWAQFTLLQPHRTIAFLGGLAATTTLAVLLLTRILEASA
jgi:uncharacterized MAPEG superfamily protein